VKKLSFVSFKYILFRILKQEKSCIFNDATHHRNSSQSAIFSSLEDTILKNPVRFIDAFVEALSLETLGFTVQTIKGRSAEL
jgi:hypothetical protein